MIAESDLNAEAERKELAKRGVIVDLVPRPSE